jgi:hypothetical protein
VEGSRGEMLRMRAEPVLPVGLAWGEEGRAGASSQDGALSALLRTPQTVEREEALGF